MKTINSLAVSLLVAVIKKLHDEYKEQAFRNIITFTSYLDKEVGITDDIQEKEEKKMLFKSTYCRTFFLSKKFDLSKIEKMVGTETYSKKLLSFCMGEKADMEAFRKSEYAFPEKQFAIQCLSYLYKDIQLADLEEKKIVHTTHKPKHNLEGIEGIYYSYINYKDLPHKVETHKDADKCVLQAVWKIEKIEGGWTIERKGMTTIRRGKVELKGDMLYFHLESNEYAYTVYFSRMSDSFDVIKCHRIFMVETELLFREILIKQHDLTIVDYAKLKADLILWTNSKIDSDMYKFIALPTYSLKDKIFREELKGLVGMWEVYFKGEEEGMYVRKILIHHQYRVEYKVKNHWYKYGYIKEIGQSSKYNIIFEDDKRSTVFTFQLEQGNTAQNVETIIAGFVASGSDKIRTGTAVLKKMKYQAKSLDDASIHCKKIKNLILDTENKLLLNLLSKDEIEIPVSSANLSIKEKVFYGDWIMISATNNIETEGLHVALLQIFNEAYISFTSSRTGESQGYCMHRDHILNISLFGEQKMASFLIDLSEGNQKDDYTMFASFSSIDKHQTLSVGEVVFVRKNIFLLWLKATEWHDSLIQNYEKSSSLYQKIEEKGILSRIKRYPSLKDEEGRYHFLDIAKLYIQQHYPDKLLKPLRKFLDKLLEIPLNAARKGVLEFKVVDTRIFEEFYSHVLEGIAGSTLYASSLASERFFLDFDTIWI